MKKMTIMLCVLLISLGAEAQFEQGKWIFNPSVTGLSLSHSNNEKTQIGFAGHSGAFILDNLALLIHAEANWSDAVDLYSLGVGERYYFESSGIYVGNSLKVKRLDWKESHFTDFSIGAEVGYAYFLSRTVTIEPAVYYDFSFKDNDYSKFGFKLGFGIYF
jgi:hypothetical protein